MHELAQRIEVLKEGIESIAEPLELPKKRKRVEELTRESAKTNFWDDQEKARNLMQELGDLKSETLECDKLSAEIEALDELSKAGEISEELEKDIEGLEERLSKLELKTYLSGKYDQKNAMVSIHAGQGGTEAMDWTSMLLRMYLRFCERRGWKTEVLDETLGEEAGIKSVTFRVVGTNSYGFLKNESGTHRLVRQSPFNADRLRQTSFASVEVLPEFTELDLPDIEIKDEDLEWQFFRSSSQGGQNVQKVSTAVRLKHKPSGTVVTAQSERYQERNRKNALDLLRSKLWLIEQERRKKEKKELKGEYVPPSWGTQIRSYVLHPYKMVKDLRTEVETSNTEAVLDGDLDKFIEAELKLSKS